MTFMSDAKHMSLEELIEENRQLKEKLEHLRRELAESVRSEIEMKYGIKSLVEQLNKLKDKASNTSS